MLHTEFFFNFGGQSSKSNDLYKLRGFDSAVDAVNCRMTDTIDKDAIMPLEEAFPNIETLVSLEDTSMYT